MEDGYKKFLLEQITSALKGACKCNFPPVYEIITDRQTPTNLLTDGLAGSWGRYTFNNDKLENF